MTNPDPPDPIDDRDDPEGKRRAFESSARSRVEQIADGWALLLNSPEESVARELHKDLHVLKTESSALGLTDLHLLCQRVEDLVFLAHRRHYKVPEEMFLTVSMAMEFLGFLVSAPEGAATADVGGFIIQLEAVLHDTESLPLVDVRQSPASHAAPAKRSIQSEDAADHLGRATRRRLGQIATDIYLESIRAERTSALRLRESWQGLQKELVRLSRVALRARLLPHIAAARVGDGDANVVTLAADVQDGVVSPEVAAVLDIAVTGLLRNAVLHGIESPEVRLAAGKAREGTIRLEARIVEGTVLLCIEDDGAGIDVAGITRAAIACGLLSPDATEDERQAHGLMFEPNVSTVTKLAGSASGEGLANVREAVRRAGGAIEVRSVRGRGTAMTVTVPDTTTNVEVLTFRSPGGQLLLAVEGDWSVSDRDTGTSVDPIRALGLPLKSSGRSLPVVFRRDGKSIEVQVRSMPVLCAASRTCPSDASALAEVIQVGPTEALLLRLDRIVDRVSQSTVPPPSDSLPDAPPRPLAQKGTSTLRRGSHKVLLVDHDVTWLVLTRSALLHRGFDVHAVSAIEDLTESVLKWGPDVLVADLEQMESEGAAVCRQIKQLRPLLPLLLFSDTNLEATQRLVTEAVADVSLSKSLGPDQLAQEILQRCGNSAV
jgi:two-component system, chemotaxis family, sensor kinase CheA